MPFSKSVLDLDTARTITGIAASVREQVSKKLHRRGAVVAVSGGIDSSVCAALCVRAFGPDHVLLLLMPEKDSSPDAVRLGKALAGSQGASHVLEDIAPALESGGCYARQREAVRMVYPDFRDDWKFKIVLPSILDTERLNISRLVVSLPNGETRSERMPAAAYLQLVAATNFKQRTRKMLEYYHADRLNYAVCGTPNRLEFDQGFFVKGGDGLADFKPIAHLYKTQVFALARALNVPDEIINRTPTTDTFSLPQTQEEFYFALPYQAMDICLYGRNHGVPAAEVAPVVGLSPEQVERVYRDIDAKRRSTSPLHAAAMLVEDVPEIRQVNAAVPDPNRGG